MVDAPARYCSNCGHALNTEDRFCPNCGRPVQETATVPTPEADMPVPPPPRAGGDFAAATQAPSQESRRDGLRNPRLVGCLSIAGLLFFATVVAAITGGGNGGGGGKVAESPNQVNKVAQQGQPPKKESQPQKEEQAQGGQQEQGSGGQKPKQHQPEQENPEPQKPSFASFGDGTYQVGTDMQPVTYRTRVGSPNCYWERLKNFTGGMNGILANGVTSAPSIVTIEPTDAGFNSQGCGTWTKDLSAITTSKTSFGPGAYIVGTDMEPGTYRSAGGRNCYYARLRGFNGGMNSVIANGVTSNPAIVTIALSDAGFQSDGCGTWTKLE